MARRPYRCAGSDSDMGGAPLGRRWLAPGRPGGRADRGPGPQCHRGWPHGRAGSVRRVTGIRSKAARNCSGNRQNSAPSRPPQTGALTSKGVVTMRRNGTLILCYHRVAEGVEDPFYLCVRPDNFAAHLEEISRAREPSTLADVSVPSRRPRVVVTFDDGYRDNLTNALPIAESKGVPITVFVTSGILGNHHGLWWDRLGTLLRSRPPHVRRSICRSAAGTSASRSVRPGSGRPRFGPPPPASASGDGDRTGTRRCLGAMAGEFRFPA